MCALIFVFRKNKNMILLAYMLDAIRQTYINFIYFLKFFLIIYDHLTLTKENDTLLTKLNSMCITFLGIGHLSF